MLNIGPNSQKQNVCAFQHLIAKTLELNTLVIGLSMSLLPYYYHQIPKKLKMILLNILQSFFGI